MRELSRDEYFELDMLSLHLLNTHGSGSSQSSTMDIKNAVQSQDIETLRVYKKLLPMTGCNTARLNIVIAFYRRRGVADLASVLTAEIVVTLVTVALAVSEATDFANDHFESPDHDLILLESLNYMDRTDEIVALIAERNITDVELFREIMNGDSTHHTAIKNGIL